MFTTFTALALAGGVLRLVLQRQLKTRWGISLGIPQGLAGALVVLAGLPEFIKPFPFPVPLGLTLGLLLPDLLLRGPRMTNLTITPGCTVLIAGFDDIPSHQFLVQEVFKDCITGTALTGPLAGEYGEPEIALVLRVLSRST
ncbi:hypothetical protein N9E15_04440 [Planktomarina temperata]|nr:hypothetical protein [Planktomarina temperata]